MPTSPNNPKTTHPAWCAREFCTAYSTLVDSLDHGPFHTAHAPLGRELLMPLHQADALMHIIGVLLTTARCPPPLDRDMDTQLNRQHQDHAVGKRQPYPCEQSPHGLAR